MQHFPDLLCARAHNSLLTSNRAALARTGTYLIKGPQVFDQKRRNSAAVNFAQQKDLV